jgi:hypothetical protein
MTRTGRARAGKPVFREEAEDPALKAQYGGFVSVWADDGVHSPGDAQQSLRAALGVRVSESALSGISPPKTGDSSRGIAELSTSSTSEIEDAVALASRDEDESCEIPDPRGCLSPFLLEKIQVSTPPGSRL